VIKRILVGLGPMPSASSEVTHAIGLAQTHGAELTAITVVDVERLTSVGPVPLGGGASARELADYRVSQAKKRIEEEIHAFEAACQTAGVTFSVKRETGNPFDLLIAHWRYHDLTILSLSSIFEHGVIEDPDDAVTRLISEGVRPILTTTGEHRPVRRALVAYNGSMHSADAFKRFARLKAWPDAEIRIVCFDGGVPEAATLVEDAAAYCRAHGYSPVSAQVTPGAPRDRILQTADEFEADVIVMGNSLRSLLARSVFGDTALYVLRNSPLPLFLA